MNELLQVQVIAPTLAEPTTNLDEVQDNFDGLLAMEQVGLDSRTICRVLDAMVEGFDFVSVEEAAHRIHHGNGVVS